MNLKFHQQNYHWNIFVGDSGKLQTGVKEVWVLGEIFVRETNINLNY